MENGELKYDINLGGELFGNADDTRRRRNADNKKLNDNKWHSILIRIVNDMLEIRLDGVVVFKKKLSAKAKAPLIKGIVKSLTTLDSET